MRRTLPLALVVAACLLSSCGSSEHHFSAVAQPTVTIGALNGEPGALRIGVVQSAVGDGSDVYGMGTGAEVAAFQLRQSGDSVEIVPANDAGEGSGGAEVVRELVHPANGQPIDALIYASTGPHVLRAIGPAVKAGIPVFLPYDSTSFGHLPAGVWMTGPSLRTEWSIIEQYLKTNYKAPAVVWKVVGRGASEGVGGFHYARTLDEHQLTSALASATTSKTAVSLVVVNASASDTAKVVEQLESAGISNVIAGPSATTPAFASDLGSSTNDQAGLISVGPNLTDLSPSPEVSTFLEAVRLLALESVQPNGSPLCFAGNGAGTADFSSHDAVLALATAAKLAGATDGPALLRQIENGLTVTSNDGIVLSPMIFAGRGVTGPSSAVSLLDATTSPNAERQDAAVLYCPGGIQADPATAVPGIDWITPQ